MSAGAGEGEGGAGVAAGAAVTAEKRRIHSPPVELPSSNAQNFFEEAKITQVEENELRRKFGKFCTKAQGGDGGEDDIYLTLDNFCCLLQYYECASAQHYESYFHAIDRNHDDKLDFQEFFLGCCAADPTTVHILNSFTGYERSRYIFDFYDTNRSETLDFDEFSRLIADCLSLPHSNPGEEQVIKSQAVEKARDLGALDESDPGLVHFTCIQFEKFYEFIQNERLRGTSRLFRFHKSIIKSRSSHHARRAQGSSVSGGGERSGGGSAGHGGGHGAGEDGAVEEEPPSDREDCEWHAHLLELDSHVAPGADAQPGAGQGLPPLERPSPPAYLALPSPAPAPPARLEQELSAAAADARAVARKVLRAACAPHFDGLLPPPGAGGADGGDAPFTIVTPAHLRSLCGAAVRLLELEEMVLTGLQPPVKVFGSLHGQLLDLLSHFRWHQPPLEDVGDILYTTYVFAGDYCDRGAHSLEVLTMLLSLKVAHPHRVALLRGHHENRHLNYHLGLRLECERRLGPIEGPKAFEHLNRVFEHMSLAAVVGGQILVLGPGVLPSSLTRLDQLRRYKKPLVIPHAMQPRSVQPMDRLGEQILLELFTPLHLMPRELGGSREATPEQVRSFCLQHKLAVVVRSRQVPARGVAFDCGGRLITLTSCLNYCDLPGGNDGAILCITKEEGTSNLQVRPKVLTARVAGVYGVLGCLGPGGGAARPASARWPAQQRGATPGRVGSAPRQVAVDGEAHVASDAAAVVVLPDRSIAADGGAALAVFPAYGAGRMPGGFVPRDGDPAALGDSPRLCGRGASDAREDRPGLRGSLGPRRSSTSGAQRSPTAQAEPESGGPTPKGAASPARGAPPRTPGGGASAAVAAAATPGGSSTVAPAQRALGAGAPDSAVVGAAAHRRGAPSPSSEAARISLGTAAAAAAPAGRGGACAANGRPKEHRGPSRPPANTAPSPKAAAAGPRAGATRRPGAEGARGDVAPGISAPASPRQSSAVFNEDGRGQTRAEADGQSFPADPQALAQLLQDSPWLMSSSLPGAPAAFLQTPRAPEQPLVWHLCRVWVEAGLSDSQWVQAMHMFEGELCDQPRQQAKAGPRGPIAGAPGAEEEVREARWTLETFSMWLLKRGRRLRECSQWFRAFDFDQDEMVSLADFLQGLVAAAAPRTPQPGSCSGLCAALALFRLLDLERKPPLDARRLEDLLADAQVSLSGFDLAMSAAQVAQRATDFEFFRTSLLPRLQTASAFRLRVFGGTAASE